MVYDPIMTYTIDQLRDTTPEDLMVLYKEAKRVSHTTQGIRQIRKVMHDISVMRRLLDGYDNLYNRKHVDD